MAWRAARGIGLGLQDALTTARGEQRLELARQATREARLVLEAAVGPEAEAARAVLSALEAAHREL